VLEVLQILSNVLAALVVAAVAVLLIREAIAENSVLAASLGCFGVILCCVGWGAVAAVREVLVGVGLSRAWASGLYCAVLILATLVIVGMLQDDLKIGRAKREAEEEKRLGKKCPTCGTRGLAVVDSKTRSFDTTSTETRTTRHYDADNNFTGTSEQDFELPTTGHETDRTYKCDSCGSRFTQRTTS
jgi:DNA-directed RNA polymerase subunit M/transcription elongation factor TFIIS